MTTPEVCPYCGQGNMPLPGTLVELAELRAALKRSEALLRRLQQLVVRA